jgi:hypothetical protein
MFHVKHKVFIGKLFMWIKETNNAIILFRIYFYKSNKDTPRKEGNFNGENDCNCKSEGRSR